MAATYETTFLERLMHELPGATADAMKEFFKEFGAIQARIVNGERLSNIEVAQAGARAQTLALAMERAQSAADAIWTSAGNTIGDRERRVRGFLSRIRFDIGQVGAAWTNVDPVIATRNFGLNAARLFGAIGNGINLYKVFAADSGEALSGAVTGWALGALGAWAGGAAGLFLAGSNPVGWAALAAVGLGSLIGSGLGSTVGESIGKDLFRQVADWKAQYQEEQRIAGLIASVESVYGPTSPTTQMVRAQLTNAVNKLGRLNGTWMQGFPELSSSDKAALTAALIGSTQGRTTMGLQNDLTALFDAGWGAGALPLRDGMIRVLSDVARDLALPYDSPRIIVTGGLLELTVPSGYLARSDSLRDAAVSLVSPSEEQYFARAIEFDRIRISLAGGAVDGAAVRDLMIGSDADDTFTGNDGADTLIGFGGIDTLDGGASYDTLFGGEGDDVLTGGTGSDYLLGGVGIDDYYFAPSDGSDVIVDADGLGRILLGTVGNAVPLTGGKQVPGVDNYWISDEINGVRYGFTQVAIKDTTGAVVRTDLVITKGSSLDRITIRNYTLGQLGITLDNAPATLPPVASTLTGDFIKAVNPSDPTRYVFDAQGNYASDGAQPDAADLLTGSATNDLIQGLGGDDALLGRDGDDTIEGGAGNDVLMGGLGADRLLGGDGNDLIYGSSNGALTYPTAIDFTPPVQSHPVLLGRGFNWINEAEEPEVPGDFPRAGYLSNSVQRDTQPNDRGNVIDGGAGLDWILAGTGADLVHGGADSDEIIGLDGGDVLLGDGGNDRVYGDSWTNNPASAAYTAPEQRGADVIDGGDGNDILVGDGGDDQIHGGTNNDLLYGDSGDIVITPAAAHGRDYLEGGAGADLMIGGGRDDWRPNHAFCATSTFSRRGAYPARAWFRRGLFNGSDARDDPQLRATHEARR